jgi:hypothetical protein
MSGWWVVEEFTEAERARLAPYVTNLDRPVFALRNLPETVKGALFARYSRSGKNRGGPGGRFRPPRSVRPGRPPCTSGSSTSTGTTRWPSSAARTSPASRPPTC